MGDDMCLPTGVCKLYTADGGLTFTIGPGGGLLRMLVLLALAFVVSCSSQGKQQMGM